MDLFTPIRRRLAAWNMLILGLLLVLVSALMYLTLEHLLLRAVDQSLAARGSQAAADRHDVAEDAVRSDEQGYQDGLFYLIAAPIGTILTNPQAVNVQALPPSVLGPPAGGPHFAALTLGGEELRLYVHPLAEPPEPGAVLVVGQSLEPTEQTLHRLVVVLFLVGGAGLALSVAGGWFLAGRALVPIQRAYARQQAFVADASHELRTPLGILRVAADLLYERRQQPYAADSPLVQDLRQELARLERLAGDLLTLARSDLGELGLEVGEVDLALLVAEVARRLTPLATERGLVLRQESAAEALPVEGDPDRLQQVLLIVLDNALKHTPPGGIIVIRTARRGAHAVITVQDSGVGITLAHAAHVFDRFYRADTARTPGGAGLGLAIAQSLVQAHGGEITLASTLGQGTTVTIEVPLLHERRTLASRIEQLTARHHGGGPTSGDAA